MHSDLARWGARIRYQTELSERYHIARSTQLLRWKLTVQFFAIASGLPAMGVLVQAIREGVSTDLGLVLAVGSAIVALLTILDQVMKFSDRTIEHRMIAVQYSDIAKEIRSKTLAARDLERIQSRIDGLQIMEQPKPLLEARCHNAIMTAYDFGAEFFVDRRVAFIPSYWAYGWPALKPPRNLASDEDMWVDKLGISVAA